ncbi:type II secretion system F family protein [Rathayibacter rathayi]|uniref:type II secretion system F family protein n=1 Tax=Rathayibacter rathayi TaxID=33887 RepID=UPI001CA529EF|nr:type II secretion system F family protein [Rathayibacter rathayi]
MIPLLIALVVMGIGFGVLFLILGLFPSKVERGPKPPSMLSRRLTHYRTTIPRKRVLLIAVGVLGGVVLWYMTGWLVALVAIPAAVIGLPILLSKPQSANSVERLEAIEAWTRSLSGLITAGVGLEQALTVSLSNAPAEIKPQVANLVARLGARWSTKKALQAFADELNDPTADLVTAHLILAAQVRGSGLANALDDLAQIVFDEVKHRREIEADREKPRTTARSVTLITLLAIGGLALSGTFLDAYRDVVGQLLLTLYVILYVVALVWMRRMSTGVATPRILVNTRKTGR